MAFPSERTLGEITAEVLARTGLGTPATVGEDVRALVQSYVRQAQEVIYYKGDWLPNRVFTTISLVTDVTEYDWPDDTRPGKVRRVSAYIGSYEWTLEVGIRPEDRSLFNQSVSAYTPTRWDFRDSIFEVWPTPKQTVPATLRIEYQLGPANLVQDADRPRCDAESCILYTVMLVRQHFQMPGVEIAGRAYEDRLRDITRSQAPPTMGQLNQYREPQDYPFSRSRPWWLANSRP